MKGDLVIGSRREVGTVGLVAGMCGAYAAVLGIGSNILSTLNQGTPGSGFVSVVLGAVALVFIGVALYVAAVVIANCVDTVVAGRLRQIALLRLLGAEAQDLRRSVVRGVARVAAFGAVVGLVGGVAVGDVVRTVLVSRGNLPEGGYSWFPLLALPSLVGILAASALAARTGSRAVLRATPAQALLGASVPPVPNRRAGVVRTVLTVLLIGAGAAILALGAALGEGASAAGLLLAMLGSMTLGTGILVGARLVVPALVSLTTRVLGRDPASVVAARNALRDPGRTTRSTMGLVIGVTLVTTFAAGFAALRRAAHSWDISASQAVQVDQILAVVSVIMICVVAVSSAIAAVGFVSTMSLGVIQRTREIGLLRALGFTTRQVRTMITKESVALSATAVLFGMALGVVFGSLGAQSLVGSLTDGFAWGVPVSMLLGVTGAGVLLVLAASWVPSTRAVRVAPVEALRAV